MLCDQPSDEFRRAGNRLGDRQAKAFERKAGVEQRASRVLDASGDGSHGNARGLGHRGDASGSFAAERLDIERVLARDHEIGARNVGQDGLQRAAARTQKDAPHAEV